MDTLRKGMTCWEGQCRAAQSPSQNLGEVTVVSVHSFPITIPQMVETTQSRNEEALSTEKERPPRLPKAS